MSDAEHTPLLGGSTLVQHPRDIQDVRVDTDDDASFASEFWFIFRTTVPVMAAYTLQNSLQTTTVVVTGRLGSDELSAAAFSMMLATVTGWCIALGGSTALDTLGSQSYTYSGRNSAVVLPHLIRCIIILWLLLLPILVVWSFSAPILMFLGQSERLSYDVQAWLRILASGAPAYVGFESIKKYFQCQGIMHASTFVLMITSPINALLSYVLVHQTRLAFYGAPLALSISYNLTFLLLMLYARWGPSSGQQITPRRASHSPDSGLRSTSSSSTVSQSQFPCETSDSDEPALNKSPAMITSPLSISELLSPTSVFSFLGLALPGILMVATEWWAFEIVALAAGRLGRLPLAAQSVVMTADQILNTLPFGLSVSASARIGNLVGDRRAIHARLSAHTAAFLSVCIGGVVMVILLIVRDSFGFIFNDDQDVVRLVAKIMPLVASFQVADGLANSCGGVLRGQGRQKLGATFNLVAYYLLALPLGITLAFQLRMGLSGLWIGQVVALFIVGIGEYIAVWRFTDWEEEVRRGVARVSV